MLDPHNLIWIMPAEGFCVLSKHPPNWQDVFLFIAPFLTFPLMGKEQVSHKRQKRGAGDTMPKRALLFVNGDLPDRSAARQLLREDDFIIAVDGGLRHALDLGLVPAVIIGDLDSVNAADLSGFEIIRHPEDKDETDLELALEYAINAGYEEIRLIGALGGRLDQTLGNLSLLTDKAHAGVDLRIDDGVEEAFFIRTQAQIYARIGEVISLIPWGDPVMGIRTEGLRWQLSDEILYPHKTRGISNEAVDVRVKIHIESGLLLIIHTRNLTGF